jgi:hypothetical protein
VPSGLQPRLRRRATIALPNRAVHASSLRWRRFVCSALASSLAVWTIASVSLALRGSPIARGDGRAPAVPERSPRVCWLCVRRLAAGALVAEFVPKAAV